MSYTLKLIRNLLYLILIQIQVMPQEYNGWKVPEKLILFDETPMNNNTISRRRDKDYPKVIKIIRPTDTNGMARYGDVLTHGRNLPTFSLSHVNSMTQENPNHPQFSRYSAVSEPQMMYHERSNILESDYNHTRQPENSKVRLKANSVDGQYFAFASSSRRGEMQNQLPQMEKIYEGSYDGTKPVWRNQVMTDNVRVVSDRNMMGIQNASNYDFSSTKNLKVPGELQLVLVEKYQDSNGTTFKIIKSIENESQVICHRPQNYSRQSMLDISTTSDSPENLINENESSEAPRSQSISH